MADGVNVDWSLWKNPVDTISDAIDKGVAARKARNSQQIRQAYATNPNDPTATANFLADDPKTYSTLMDAQTAQLKAHKAMSDAAAGDAADAVRRAYISATLSFSADNRARMRQTCRQR